MKRMFEMGISMMIRRFAIFIFLVGMMMPVAGYAAPPPDDFEETARIAKIIIQKNPWVFHADRIRVDNIAYIETTSRGEYKCHATISAAAEARRGSSFYMPDMWIGYDEDSDRYYVDVVESPKDNTTSSKIFMAIKYLTNNTVRLWESNTRRRYRKR